jgi:hypothetical protein
MESHPGFQRHVWGEGIVGDQLKGVGIPDAVAIGWRYHHVLLVTDGHPMERLLETGDDLAPALQELQGACAVGGGDDLAVVEAKRVVETDHQVVGDGKLFLC